MRVTGQPAGIEPGDKLVEPHFDGYQWQEEFETVRGTHHLDGVSILFLANPWKGSIIRLSTETVTYEKG